MAFFSHRPVFRAPYPYPASIIVIGPACSRAFLPVRVTLFASGMLSVTNIGSIYHNNNYVCGELSEEHAGENLMSRHWTVFEISMGSNIENDDFAKIYL